MTYDITITTPWSPDWSKNVRNGGPCSGRAYRRVEVDAFEAEIAEKLNKTGPWYKGKIWLDTHVEMPNRRGDAINTLDFLADAIKKAIGVDDKWFAIHKLDWEVAREKPTITIRVFQEVDRDYHYCSTCMNLYEWTHEFFYKSNKHGLTYDCRKCKHAGILKWRAEKKLGTRDSTLSTSE